MAGFDLQLFFSKYEELVERADKAFNTVKKEYGEHVKCREGCSDCCWALFDLTLVEAMHINYAFNKNFKDKEREELLERAGQADRKAYKIKKEAKRDQDNGKNEVEILSRIGMEKIRCPLLNKNDMCAMYQERPITCRVYGIPTAIEGISHICGKTGFSEGEMYPTLNMDIIHKRLYGISAEFAGSIKTKYLKLADMLVPLSTALLTDYNDEYLGIVERDLKKEE